MKINIDEIAKKAGVSIATVSRALNSSGPVKPETRRRIQEIAREYHYQPHPFARGLSKRRTDTIGVILPELNDEFFMDIIHGVDEEAYRANKYVMISSSHSRRDIIQTLVEFMGSGRVDGMILMVPQLQNEAAELIRHSKRPVVLVNVSQDIDDVVSFNINNYQGAFTIVEHLITKHNYKKIGMILGPEGNWDAAERYRGFRDALNQYAVPLKDNLIVQGNFTAQSGFYGFGRLMSQQDKPEAIFAANDMMAVGIYQAAREVNLNIPHDVAVIGFDDIFLSKLLNPRLTTMHVPISELGSKAIRYLFKMIDESSNYRKPYREELTAGLMIGRSCGCDNNNGQYSFF